MTPAIIEVAINGVTTREINPAVPISADEISAEALSCLDAGAAIIHNHIEDIHLTGREAGQRYGNGWGRVLAKRPDAILCPTTTLAPIITDKVAHFAPCAAVGARMGAIDTGSVNLADTAPDGSPGGSRFAYVNSFDDLEVTLETLGAAKLGPSIAIFDPSFLRATLAYHRAGKLPAGAMVKLYFGGEYDLGKRNGGSRHPALSFGLPPTRAALEAYLEMLEGSKLPWAVAVLGGDVVACGMARLALERGGHVRVGLEDYGGADAPTNMDLLNAALDELRSVGRPPATCQETAAILNLPA